MSSQTNMDSATPSAPSTAATPESSNANATSSLPTRQKKQKSTDKPKPPKKKDHPISFTSILPSTPYRDINDPGTHNPTDPSAPLKPKSYSYIHAQRALLSWLTNHTTSELTAGHARAFTEAIQSDKCPSSTESLRFCYYMREQGCDTYAKLDVEKDQVRLYIANQDVFWRYPERKVDKLYWSQSWKSGAISEVSVASGHPALRASELPSTALGRAPPFRLFDREMATLGGATFSATRVGNGGAPEFSGPPASRRNAIVIDRDTGRDLSREQSEVEDEEDSPMFYSQREADDLLI